jgi:hypothetical protein
MFFSKREKVPPQEIWRNLLDECQRICVAIFNESTQELSVELEGVSGKLSCLAVDQKRIGCYPVMIP